MNHSLNTKKIAHVLARVEQLSHSPNTHKIKHTPVKEPSGKQKPAETKYLNHLQILHAVHSYTNYLITNTGKQQYLNLIHPKDTTQYGTTIRMKRNSHQRRY